MIKDSVTPTQENYNSQNHKNGTKNPNEKPVTTVGLLNDIFFNGTEWHARGYYNGSDMFYGPVEGNPDNEAIFKHIEGDVVLGSYTLLPNSMVLWACLDVDVKPYDETKARNITEAISEKLGTIPHATEFSGNKGFHIWFFFDAPVAAAKVKPLCEKIRDSIGAAKKGDIHVECFPKQAKLTTDQPKGNLVKLPLGIHPKTQNRSEFVDRFNNWEPVTEKRTKELLAARVSFADFAEQVKNIEVEPETEGNVQEKLIALISTYWIDGQRHDVALSLCGYLATLGWSKNDVDELVKGLVAEKGGDLKDLLSCARDTFERLAAGTPVQGFSGLLKFLPLPVMRKIAELGGKNTAEPIIQLLDRIRLDKGAAFLKVRSATKAIFSDLSEKGRFIRSIEGEGQYWFEFATCKLWECSDVAWKPMVFQRYGINRSDGFSNQVRDELELTIYNRTEKLPIYNQFHFDGKVLWINFGGVEVYRLDGTTDGITLQMNGAGNLLFRTDSNGLNSMLGGVDLRSVLKLDPWNYLTTPINFEKKDGVNTAEPEQQKQILQALILSIMFPELHKTKPISGLLGPRGSGKTTASRNILRFICGLAKEVITLAEDKPDSLRASVDSTSLIVLDNLENCKAKWLTNFLNSLATGANIELKTLYKTNDKTVIKPRCFVQFSAINIPPILAEEAFVSRLLPLQMESLSTPKSESFLQKEFETNFVGMWAGMLAYLNLCVASLNAHDSERGTAEKHRLADFANFCRRLRDLPNNVLDCDLLRKGLDNLGDAQARSLAPESAALQAIDLWLTECRDKTILLVEHDPRSARTTKELFAILEPIARKQKIDWRWTNGQKLALHLTIMDSQLKNNYGATIAETRDAKGNKLKTYAFEL